MINQTLDLGNLNIENVVIDTESNTLNTDRDHSLYIGTSFTSNERKNELGKKTIRKCNIIVNN